MEVISNHNHQDMRQKCFELNSACKISSMSEGKKSGGIEPPQINCLFVNVDFCDQGAFRRWKPQRSDNDANDVKNERAIAMVYNNDLLMRHIISFVTDVNDRTNVELASSRLRRLSRTSLWRFKSGGDTLSLTYKTFNDCVSVEIGEIYFVLPSTTMESRMRRDSPRNTQPAKLMNTLYGMAERFALEVRTIRLGGTDSDSRSRGVQNHQLIVTSDLLKLFNDRFKNVHAISFTNCGFDQDAIAFLSSDACVLSKKINDLSIDGIWFDSTLLIRKFTLTSGIEWHSAGSYADVDYLDIARLAGLHKSGTSILEDIELYSQLSFCSGLRKLKLENFKILPFGVELFSRIRELKVVLDEVYLRLTVANIHNLTLQDVRSFLETISAATNELRIDIACSQSKRGGMLFLALRVLPTLKNITELQLIVQPKNRREVEDLAYVLHSLGKLPSLRKISCGGWKCYGMSVALQNGLLRCCLLEELIISDIIETGPDEIADLLSSIPRSVKSLSLGSLSVTDSDLMFIFEELTALKKLKLAKLPRVSSSGIYRAISGLSNLEELHCSVPVNSVMLRSIVDSRIFRRLQNINLVITNGYPQDYEELLSRYFVDVYCTNHYLKPRWCCIKAERRRRQVAHSPSTELNRQPLFRREHLFA